VTKDNGMLQMGHGTSEKIYDSKKNVRKRIKVDGRIFIKCCWGFCCARKLEADFMSLIFDVMQLVGVFLDEI